MNKLIYSLILFPSLIIQSCGLKTNSPKSENIIDSSDFDIEHFQPLPKEYAYKERAYLIDKIKPEDNYSYWECVWKDMDNGRGKIIVYQGDSSYSIETVKINPTTGFFVECMPLFCFSYIVGVRPDHKVDLVNTNEQLKKFIGHIDNIEEVILSAKLNGFWFDTDTIIGGAYRERNNDYLLYLLDYSSTPVTYKSAKAVLKKNGDFQLIMETKYKETDEYIVE